MSKKRFILRLKEKGSESYRDFIRMISTDSVFKKRVDKAIFLNYAMISKEVSKKEFFKTLGKIFLAGEVSTEWDLFSLKYDYYTKTFDEKKLSRSWHIKPKYFEWVSGLVEEGDSVFFPDKFNPGQFIKDEEFKFLAFKLTEVLIKRRGYNTITRSFFVRKDLPFYKSYYKATGRKMTKGKFAHMVSVLSKRDIIYRYRRPNKANLFVIGEKNPYFELYNVVTNEDIANIYSKYNIDTSDHFKRQTFGKNLIPGKKEREHRKQRLEVIREKARIEAVRREREKQEKERSIAFNKRRNNVNDEEVDDEDDYHKKLKEIVVERKASREAV